MNDSQLADFADANVKILPHIIKLTGQYEKDQNPETLALLNDAGEEALVVALSNKGAFSTLRSMGYDPEKLRKQLEGSKQALPRLVKKLVGSYLWRVN